LNLLKPSERPFVFGIFCVITILCVVVEIYLIYAMIAQGFTTGKVVIGVLHLTVTFAVGGLFVKVARKALLEPDDIISFSKLHRFASYRSQILERDELAQVDDYAIRQHLVTEALKFAEEFLHGWLPGSHFEICIFVDSEQPLLFAYFDSNHERTARSMRHREENANWYVENKYEVLKVLATRTSHPLIIQDTEKKQANYSFGSSQQKKQLKSTMLWCIDVNTPCAIVVSSNIKNAFRESDPEVISFIKFVGNLARFDLFQNRFLHRIRNLRPDLFPASHS
jgi:hypothetical protein